MRLRILRLHAGYRCAHSGVCCTAGWGIPVEAPVHARLSAALDRGVLRTDGGPAAAFVPAEAVGAGPPGQPLLAKRDGACIFFEPAHGNLCAVHRQMGSDALPSACRHFPRVVVVDPRGVSMSLSMVCPTAGRLLLRPMDGPLDLVPDGPVAAGQTAWEGLDARDALPPRLNDAVLWDWAAMSRWESGVLGVLAGAADAESALGAILDAAARIEPWTPADGVPLAAHVEAMFRAGGAASRHRHDLDALDALARASVPAPLICPAAPPDRRGIDRRLVAPVWQALGPPVLRYLAGRTIANWATCYTTSARGCGALLAVAYAVLRVEAARACREADRMLDEPLLVRAAAEADRLLVHLSSAAELARRVDAFVRS
jgi:Fe-S-cluster containining protein